MNSSRTNKPFGLYIHIPFCQAICPFCDFNKLKANSQKYDAYTKACLRDIYAYRDIAAHKRVESVFFGGGTPSVMPVVYLERLLEGVRKIFDCSNSIYICSNSKRTFIHFMIFNKFIENFN